MTERNPNQDQPNRESQHVGRRDDREELNQTESTEPRRTTRDRESVADDRQHLRGREDVDLGTDMEPEPGIEDSDEEFGGSRRSDR